MVEKQAASLHEHLVPRFGPFPRVVVVEQVQDVVQEQDEPDHQPGFQVPLSA